MHFEIIRTELVNGKEIPATVVNVRRDACRKRDFRALCHNFMNHPEALLPKDQHLWESGRTFRYEFLCWTRFGGVYVGLVHDVGDDACTTSFTPFYH